jgi:hypothetical protein
MSLALQSMCRAVIIWGGRSHNYGLGIENLNVMDWDNNRFIREEMTRSGISEVGGPTAVISSKYFDTLDCTPSNT